nr:hypothetical protein [Nitrosomonas nitrosa]
MTDFDLQGFLYAHSRYQGVRDAAYHVTWEKLSPSCQNLKLWSIDDAALAFVDHYWRAGGVSHPDGGFPWRAITEQFHSTPRRFEIAIWSGNTLCGMAFGLPSRGADNVTIRFIERYWFSGNPLIGWIAPIVIDAADNYAKLLGKQWVKLKNPIIGAIPYYVALGFELAEPRLGATYYRRKVT